MSLTDEVIDLKAGAILDYYVSGLWWARDQLYTPEQTSAFFTVQHMMLENVKGNYDSMTTAGNYN